MKESVIEKLEYIGIALIVLELIVIGANHLNTREEKTENVEMYQYYDAVETNIYL
jgi:undecaprenyl pyrophosphate phosphatase UppP